MIAVLEKLIDTAKIPHVVLAFIAIALLAAVCTLTSLHDNVPQVLTDGFYAILVGLGVSIPAGGLPGVAGRGNELPPSRP